MKCRPGGVCLGLGEQFALFGSKVTFDDTADRGQQGREGIGVDSGGVTIPIGFSVVERGRWTRSTLTRRWTALTHVRAEMVDRRARVWQGLLRGFARPR